MPQDPSPVAARDPTNQGDAPGPEQATLLAHLTSRAAALGPGEIHARFGAAARAFEEVIDGVGQVEARRQPRAGEWSIAQVVDHLAQTTIRSADELRHLLAGRRPPAPPVYEALTSGAAHRAPWPGICAGLRSANRELDRLLAQAADTPPAEGPGTPTARTILVVTRRAADGADATEDRVAPELFAAELGWKAYALVQRLHLLEHRAQVKALRVA